jgi:biotin carboxyl carrier protein
MHSPAFRLSRVFAPAAWVALLGLTAAALDAQSPSAAPLPSPTATPLPAEPSQDPALQKPGRGATQIAAEFDRLKQQGKLANRTEVAAAVRRVIADNSEQHEIPAPLGAKVIAVHKHPGDLVHVGDKIVTLLVNGKEVPVLARQEGIMQTINVSKGGVIGNSLPSAVKAGRASGGSILIAMTPL